MYNISKDMQEHLDKCVAIYDGWPEEKKQRLNSYMGYEEDEISEVTEEVKFVKPARRQIDLLGEDYE